MGTHGLHDEIPRKHIVEADVLLHGGDFTNTGEFEQVQSFAEWLRSYPAKHKVVIAGNHDITFDTNYYATKWHRFHRKPYDSQKTRDLLVKSDCCVYLEDQKASVLGYEIYGSPAQPEFCDWAFNFKRGAACKAIWDGIPAEVD